MIDFTSGHIQERNDGIRWKVAKPGNREKMILRRSIIFNSDALNLHSIVDAFDWISLRQNIAVFLCVPQNPVYGNFARPADNESFSLAFLIGIV